MDTRRLIVVALLGISALLRPLAAAAEAPTPQVQQVAAVFGDIEDDGARIFASDERIDTAVALVFERCIAALEQNALNVFGVLAKRDLLPVITAQLRGRIKKLASHYTVVEVPYDARLAITRMVTMQSSAYAFLDQWLEVPPHAGGDEGRLAAVAAIPDDARATPALMQQLHVVSEGPLQLDESSALLEDKGGPGAGNGVLDAGEWVQLRIALNNPSDTSLFSTSAWLSAPDGCLWVDKRHEYELAEMSPGSGKASFDAWVFLAADCGHSDARPLDIMLYDTHELASKPQTITAHLQVYSAGGSELDNTRIDADLPGSSDGQDVPAVGPGRRFELSAGLRVGAGDGTAALQTVAMSRLGRGVFESVDLRIVLMRPRGGGYFLPGDDVDLKVLDGDAYEQSMAELGRGSDWYSTQQGGRIWVALDTVVTRPFVPVPSDDGSAGPMADGNATVASRAALEASLDDTDKAAVESGTESRAERRRRRREQRRREREARRAAEVVVGEGAPASASTERVASAACGRTPSAAEVADLVKGRVGLVARPAVPLLADAVGATEGYEIVFDRDGFLDAYDALVGECAPAITTAATPLMVRYRYRNYLELKLPKVDVKTPRVAVRETFEEAPVEEPEDPAILPVAKLRVDLGTGIGMYSLSTPSGWSSWPDGRTTATFGLRTSYGKKTTAVVELGYASFRESGVVVSGRQYIVDLSEISFGAGVGYVAKPVPSLELHPHITVGAQYRSYEATGAGDRQWASVTSFGVTPGIAVRKFFSRALLSLPRVGLFADLSYSLFGGGPNTHNGDDPIADGNVLRMLIGLTLEL